MASTGMIIDGALGSECIDSSGEVLDVEGADISDLEEGRGVLNYEHQNAEDEDKEGKKANQGQEIVGKILSAKKIFKETDCENARQRLFWKKIKHPYIYGVCRLYDGAGHEGAKALAAQIRDHVANSEPILVRFSVEGSTLEKEGNILKRSVIRRVALTLKPCNRTADSGLLEDPNAPKGFEKLPNSPENILAGLGEDTKKFEHQHPLYNRLGGSTELEYVEFEESDHRALVKSLVKFKAMKKALNIKAMLSGKGSPEDHKENEQNQAGFLGNPANQDSYMEQTGAVPQTHAEAPHLPSWMVTLAGAEERDGHAPYSYIVNAPSFKMAHAAVDLHHRQQVPDPDYPLRIVQNQSGPFQTHFLHNGKISHYSVNRVSIGRDHYANDLRTETGKLNKATEAGSYDAAPSSLTGGAALQREDVSRFRSRALRTVKSFLDKNFDFSKDEAKAFLRAELPEASDEFIDHFTDIAEDYKLKLRKADEKSYTDKSFVQGTPKTDPNLPGVQEVRVDRTKETPGAMKSKQAGGLEMETGGKTLIQRPGASRMKTPGKKKSRPAPRLGLTQSFPNDDIYNSLLKPDDALAAGKIDEDQHTLIMNTVHAPWHRAMANWLPLNAALHEGKVPRGIIAKSVIFAAMSPNTSVPLQERYYGHYMDMLNDGQVDPFKPISQSAISDFTQRSTDGRLPKWNHEYYAAHPLNINANGQNEIDEASSKGELPQIMGLKNAHLLYPYLEHLLARHKDDTQGVAAELMDMKDTGNKHKNVQDRYNREGKGVAPNAPAFPRILGNGPKLTRYMLGMLGGGNMIVPDRHMVRSTFDLHMKDDEDVLKKLQTQVVTDSKNEPFLRAIDHNFFQKHPAVKHVLETFPKHFKGREEQAIFPAFWLHWLTIGHYDRMRNRPSMAFNEGTDHQVFWDSVKDEMIKAGLHPHPIEDRMTNAGDQSFNFGANVKKSETELLDPWPRHPNHAKQPVWLKAAGALHALTQRWGENPALMAYFSHIVPKVLEAETPVPPVQGVAHSAYNPALVKAEGLLIDLRKALADQQNEHPALGEIAPHVHHVYSYHVNPDRTIGQHMSGRFLTAGGHVNVLEDYHGHLGQNLIEGPMDDLSTAKVGQLRSNPQHEVVPLSDIRSGKRPELWTPTKAATPAPKSSFDYTRHGQTKADHLEYIGGKPHLNGFPMSQEQERVLMRHVKNGHASVRYRTADPIQKMELKLRTLLKASALSPEEASSATGVHGALGRLDELVKQGLLEPHHAEALRQHAFMDPMTGNSMGNKFAFTDFINRAEGKGGVHVGIDANDFKSVNDKYGHEAGDQAIKAMGGALRAAADETGEGKLFRVGGDEFAAHFPTHEHAARFARAVSKHMDKIPEIAGTHKLSLSLGLGTDHHQADKALAAAKTQKYVPGGMTGIDNRKWASKYAPGKAPHFAHSLVPGFEGAIPLDHSQLQVKAPPAPAPAPEAPKPVVQPPAPQAAAPVPAPHLTKALPKDEAENKANMENDAVLRDSYGESSKIVEDPKGTAAVQGIQNPVPEKGKGSKKAAQAVRGASNANVMSPHNFGNISEPNMVGGGDNDKNYWGEVDQASEPIEEPKLATMSTPARQWYDYSHLLPPELKGHSLYATGDNNFDGFTRAYVTDPSGKALYDEWTYPNTFRADKNNRPHAPNAQYRPHVMNALARHTAWVRQQQKLRG